MMMNIEPETKPQPKPRAKPRATATKLHLYADEWGWEQLRDYVVGRIEHYSGPFERVFFKEEAVFKSFVKRWPNAQAIAKYAFEVMEGQWQGKWINVNMFTKGADSWFAGVIADRLAE